MGRVRKTQNLIEMVEKGNEAQKLENNESSVPKIDASVQNGESLPKKRVKRKKQRAIVEALNSILSMEIAPDTVSDMVKRSPLGEKITYQEAILLAQVIKASNGDTQAAVFIRDSSGNKLKDGLIKLEKKIRFEDL